MTKPLRFDVELSYYDVSEAFRQAEERVREIANDTDHRNPYEVKLKLLGVELTSEDFGRCRRFTYEFEASY